MGGISPAHAAPGRDLAGSPRTAARKFFRNAGEIMALKERSHREDTMKIRPIKPNRAPIDLSDETLARGWAKKLGKSKEEIAAAIEKVGDNAETVKRELGCADDEGDE
jgi:hypothetical protein